MSLKLFFFSIFVKTVTNLNFLVLLAVWGLAAGGVNAFLIMVPQYLCPYGYSNVRWMHIHTHISDELSLHHLSIEGNCSETNHTNVLLWCSCSIHFS